MAISKELLEILACPVCKVEVRLTPNDTGLKCVKCHRVYPIRDDIPVAYRRSHNRGGHLGDCGLPIADCRNRLLGFTSRNNWLCLDKNG
jgi:uncharacterized protein YbaR (Trm112 family)